MDHSQYVTLTHTLDFALFGFFVTSQVLLTKCVRHTLRILLRLQHSTKLILTQAVIMSCHFVMYEKVEIANDTVSMLQLTVRCS